MTDTAISARPVPRWLLALAIVVGALSLFLLVLGQLVTTLKAGMADPLWPTEPWYLIKNYKNEVGYLVEHSHRIAGYTLGSLIGILALGIWWTEPRQLCRWTGLAALIGFIGSFGAFQGAVMAQTDPNHLAIPTISLAAMGASLLLLVAISGSGMATGIRGSGLRLLAVVVLLAVMSQGVLGGLRVRLNALHGPELAAVHGVFAQIVFSLLVLLAYFCTRPPGSELTRSDRGSVRTLSLLLVAVLLGQLVLGVLVRHMPTPLAQRLHILTAFLAVAVVVWLLRAGFTNPLTRPRIAPAGWFLGMFVAIQVVLGVEAWMGKFSQEAWAGKAADSYLVETAVPPPYQVAIRTAHVLVGTVILASAVVLAVAVRRPVGATVEQSELVQTMRSEAVLPRPVLAVAGVSQSGELTR